MGKTLQYKVARLTFRVETKSDEDYESRLPSFAPFKTDVTDEPALFTLTVDNDFRPEYKGEEIGQFDCGGNNHGVYQLKEGGYQILVSNVHGHKCCLLQTNKDCSEGIVALHGTDTMMNFGINNSLMMMFAFAAADKGTLLMHASVIRKDGNGYLFLGVSGTGKSTHTSNWLKYIKDCDLMNDDNPVVRFIDGKTIVFGSPWSGKTPCYRNIEALVGGFVQLKQAPFNKIRKMGVIETFASILPSCSVMKWDKRVYCGICDTVQHVIETTNTYFLENLPDEAAVRMSFGALTSEEEPGKQ